MVVVRLRGNPLYCAIVVFDHVMKFLIKWITELRVKIVNVVISAYAVVEMNNCYVIVIALIV
jgi:hypothetical protein